MINIACDTFATATTLLRELRARRISSVELLEMHIHQIHKWNPKLNAIVTMNYEQARNAANNADILRMRGGDAPLLGLPITIKDTINVQALPTTAGLSFQANTLAQADAGIVACLRGAGAIILGKTNVPTFGSDWQTNNQLFGRSNNPWDITRTPGGSTGGGAAAIATGMSAMEIGTDIAGSIRIPAAFCGVYGYKPSETLQPFSGHFPGSCFPNTVTPLAVQGPLARDAQDLELAFEAMTTGMSKDRGETWHLHIPAVRHKHLSDYRVAILPQLKWLPVDKEILDAQDRIISNLSQHGLKVRTLQPEVLGDLRHFYELYVLILAAITSASVPTPTRYLHALAYRLTGDEFYTIRSRGLLANAADYISWFSQRECYRAAFRTFFSEWDILLTPNNIVNAFPHTDLPFSRRKLDVNQNKVRYFLQNAYPGFASLCGLPSVAFPVGLTSAGLPIGLQAIGPYLEDRTPLRFVKLLSEEFGGFQRPPGYDC